MTKPKQYTNEYGEEIMEYTFSTQNDDNLKEMIFYDDVVITIMKQNEYRIIKKTITDKFLERLEKDTAINKISVTNYLRKHITTICVEYNKEN